MRQNTHFAREQSYTESAISSYQVADSSTVQAEEEDWDNPPPSHPQGDNPQLGHSQWNNPQPSYSHPPPVHTAPPPLLNTDRNGCGVIDSVLDFINQHDSRHNDWGERRLQEGARGRGSASRGRVRDFVEYTTAPPSRGRGGRRGPHDGDDGGDVGFTFSGKCCTSH